MVEGISGEEKFLRAAREEMEEKLAGNFSEGARNWNWKEMWRRNVRGSGTLPLEGPVPGRVPIGMGKNWRKKCERVRGPRSPAPTFGAYYRYA